MENKADQEILILELFEILFKDFGVNRISLESLSDLVNEFDLLKMLQEIEPELLIVTEMEDINLLKEPAEGTLKKNRTKGELKSRNMKEIIKCLTIYFENCPNKNKLSQNFKIEKLLNLENLLDYNLQDLFNLAEVLLVLSAISSKCSEYVDTLNANSEIETKYMDYYVNILEKYLIFEKDETLNNFDNENRTPFARQTTKHFSIQRKASFKKRMTIRNKEKFQFMFNIEELEKDIANLNSKNEELTNDLLELELKFRDTMRENESLKKSLNQHYQFEEESYNDAVMIANLKNELMKKELEMEEIKKEHDMNLKRLKDDLVRITTVKESLEDRLEEFKSVKFENDKLKLRIKELNLNKEKLNTYDNMVASIESKNKQIESLIKEKQNFLAQTEKLIKENQTDKEKLKEMEYEKKKIEYELFDFKKDVRNFSRRGTIQKFGEGVRETFKFANNTNINHLQSGIALDQIQDLSNINQDELLNNLQNVDLEREVEDLRQELEEMKTMYKEQIEINHKLIEEINEKENLISKLKIEIDSNNSEKQKLIIEKEKLEIGKQKIELEFNKIHLVIDKLETEKMKLIDELNQSKNKLEQMVDEKNSNLKEIENLRMNSIQKDNLLKKIKMEKEILESRGSGGSLGSGSAREGGNTNSGGPGPSTPSNKNVKLTSTSSTKNTNSGISPTHKNSLNSEVSELKVEISRLKASSISKDENIKQLKERIKHLEKLEGMIKSKDNKKDSDLQYFKKSFEEQKKIVNQEHELISNNLCELANQFIIFKNELLKNVKPSILKQNNIIG